MREDIIVFFWKGIFLFKGNVFKTKEDESEDESEELIKDCYKKFIRYIENESEGINYDLFEDHFNFVVPSVLAKKLYELKNKKENDKLVNVIKSGLSDLKNKIKKMSEDKKIWKTISNIKNCWRNSWVLQTKPIRKRFKNTDTKPNA